jgi:hypothetical protein
MLSGQGVVTQGGSADAQKTNNKRKSIGRIRFMANPYHFVVGLWRAKRHNVRVKYYWEIISDNLKKRGWSLGYVSAIDTKGRTIWIADAHRSDGKRFVVRADEKLTAFVELESATRRFRRFPAVFVAPKRIGLKSNRRLSGVLIQCL